MGEEEAGTPERTEQRGRVGFLVLAPLGASLLFAAAVVVWSAIRPAPLPNEPVDEPVRARVVPEEEEYRPPLSRPLPPDPGALPRGTISGVVVRADGRPAASGSVCLVYDHDERVATGLPVGPVCVPLLPDGRYALTGVLAMRAFTISASSSESGAVRPRARAPGALAVGEERTAVDFVLRSDGVPFDVTLRGPSSVPVAGAAVAAWNDMAVVVGETDSAGVVRLVVNPGELRLSARATGYAWPSVLCDASDGHVTLHLIPGATLSGRVTGPGDRVPPAGLRVMLSGWNDRSHQARTEEGGSFRFEGLTPGRYDVHASLPGQSGHANPTVPVGLGENVSDVVVPLVPQFLVDGTVTAEGGLCLRGKVMFRRQPDRGPDSGQVTAEVQKGVVRSATLGGGSYRVAVQCDGARGAEPDTLELRDGDPPPQTWVVGPQKWVQRFVVHVVDPAGKRVTDANVKLHRHNGALGTDLDAVDGAFVGHVRVNEKTTASVHAKVGDRWVGSTPVEVAFRTGHRVELTVKLAPASVLEGVVVDTDGRRVPNAAVSMTGTMGRAQAKSREDGSFRIGGLLPGQYDVRGIPWHDHAGSKATASVRVEVHGSTKATVVVPRRDQVVDGVVLDHAGKPIAGALVEAKPGDSCTPFEGFGGLVAEPVRSDAQGRFRLAGFEEGRLTIRAIRPGSGEALVEDVPTGADGIVIRVHRKASIDGSIVPDGGGEGFRIEARQRHRGLSERFSKGTAFVLRGLEPGEHLILVDGPSGTQAATYVTLGDGENLQGLTLRTSAQGSVRGRIVSLETGAPLAGYQVSLSGPEPGGRVVYAEDHWVDGDGRFQLASAPGRRLLAVRPVGEFMSDFVSVEARAGDVVDVGDVAVSTTKADRTTTIGVSVEDDDLTRREPLPLRVLSVDEAAKGAGLRVGDVVVKVDGRDVRGKRRYQYDALTRLPPGRPVVLALERGVEVTVVAKTKEQ